MFTDCLDHLKIPESHRTLLEKAGAAAPYTGDQRRFARRYLITKAVFESQPSLPALPRSQQRHVIVVLDISRSGLGFFHSEQLFPCERATIQLMDDKRLPVEITWCQRIAENCYQIGAKFSHIDLVGTDTSTPGHG